MEARQRNVVIAIVVLAVVVFIGWRLSRTDAGTKGDGKSGSASTNANAKSSTSNANANANINATNAGPMLSSSVGAGPTQTPTDASTYAKVKWGTGPDELGHFAPKEANPEAPMSLAVDANGNVVVLDQVNGRLVRLGKDGKPIESILTPVKAAQDVATAKDGSLLVLDRLADKAVSVIGPDGKVQGSLPIVGDGVKEGGAVTGVFVEGKNVYVEREHAGLVLVGDTSGKPATDRKELPGRPTRDGLSFLNAWLLPPPGGDSIFLTSTQRAPEEHRWTRQYHLPMSVTNLLLLDSDLAGVVYVAAMGFVASEGKPDGDPRIELLCIESVSGVPLGEVTLPSTTLPDETFRDFVVLDEGGAIYAYRTDAGVTLMKVDCRKGG